MDWGLLVGVLGVPASVALTMGATSKGEFHFIRGCFIAVACGTISAHLWWQWANEASLTGWRVAIGGLVGAVTVAGLVIALDWVKRKETAAIPEKPTTTEAAGELLLECQQAPLPNTGLPRETTLVMISPFRFDKEGTIGFSATPMEWGQPMNWPEDWKNKSVSSARCRLTNYGNIPLFNVEVPFRVIFRRLARGGTPGSITSNEVINVAEASLPITKIETGPDGAYIFYIHNQGRDLVQTQFMDGATCIPPRSTERRPITLIQSTSVIHSYNTLWPIRPAEEIVAEEEKSKEPKKPKKP
jgi:hypothetical protein